MLLLGGLALASLACAQAPPTAVETPQYRPAFHFTPKAHWMNDPNGLVYRDGVYHLYFQYYPDGLVWGPMHWGHATSRDLAHWREESIALAPDALGMMFSGSAIDDPRNVSGLGSAEHPPLVAILTQHNDERYRAGRLDVETQSVAASTDGGYHFTMYAGNPVIDNPGFIDFRDPNVAWDEARQRYRVTLAAGDRVMFYQSTDLLHWTKTGEFGVGVGAHGSVWECPNLFTLKLGDRQRWVLLVSVVSGAPNGGSGTQYFIGDFDGSHFVPEHGDVRWLDHGTDNYAGALWNGTGEQRIFIGWMSNWTYAQQVPTAPWRSAMTVPRELHLESVDGETRLVQTPAPAFEAAWQGGAQAHRTVTRPSADLSGLVRGAHGHYALDLDAKAPNSAELQWMNDAGDVLKVGYDASSAVYFIDRRAAGDSGFNASFASRQTVPRVNTGNPPRWRVYLDSDSVELFGDGGLAVLSAQVFPHAPYSRVRLTQPGHPSTIEVAVTEWPATH
jgi:fructan beta-fructosidase